MARPIPETPDFDLRKKSKNDVEIYTNESNKSIFDISDRLSSNTSKNFVIGTFSGWMAGVSIVKLGRITAFGLGGSVILLHFASELGYINVNWERIKESAGQSQAWLDWLFSCDHEALERLSKLSPALILPPTQDYERAIPPDPIPPKPPEFFKLEEPHIFEKPTYYPAKPIPCAPKISPSSIPIPNPSVSASKHLEPGYPNYGSYLYSIPGYSAFQPVNNNSGVTGYHPSLVSQNQPLAAERQTSDFLPFSQPNIIQPLHEPILEEESRDTDILLMVTDDEETQQPPPQTDFEEHFTPEIISTVPAVVPPESPKQTESKMSITSLAQGSGATVTIPSLVPSKDIKKKSERFSLKTSIPISKIDMKCVSSPPDSVFQNSLTKKTFNPAFTKDPPRVEIQSNIVIKSATNEPETKEASKLVAPAVLNNSMSALIKPAEVVNKPENPFRIPEAPKADPSTEPKNPTTISKPIFNPMNIETTKASFTKPSDREPYSGDAKNQILFIQNKNNNNTQNSKMLLTIQQQNPQVMLQRTSFESKNLQAPSRLSNQSKKCKEDVINEGISSKVVALKRLHQENCDENDFENLITENQIYGNKIVVKEKSQGTLQEQDLKNKNTVTEKVTTSEAKNAVLQPNFLYLSNVKFPNMMMVKNSAKATDSIKTNISLNEKKIVNETKNNLPATDVNKVNTIHNTVKVAPPVSKGQHVLKSTKKVVKSPSNKKKSKISKPVTMTKSENVFIGKPKNIVIKKTERIIKKPNMVTSKPDILISNPNTALSTPKITKTKPDILISNPNIVVTKPDTVTTKPNIVISKPDMPNSMAKIIITLPESAYQTNQNDIKPPIFHQVPISSMAEEDKISYTNIMASLKDCHKVIAQKEAKSDLEISKSDIVTSNPELVIKLQESVCQTNQNVTMNTPLVYQIPVSSIAECDRTGPSNIMNTSSEDYPNVITQTESEPDIVTSNPELVITVPGSVYQTNQTVALDTPLVYQVPISSIAEGDRTSHSDIMNTSSNDNQNLFAQMNSEPDIVTSNQEVVITVPGPVYQTNENINLDTPFVYQVPISSIAEGDRTGHSNIMNTSSKDYQNFITQTQSKPDIVTSNGEIVITAPGSVHQSNENPPLVYQVPISSITEGGRTVSSNITSTSSKDYQNFIAPTESTPDIEMSQEIVLTDPESVHQTNQNVATETPLVYQVSIPSTEGNGVNHPNIFNISSKEYQQFMQQKESKPDVVKSMPKIIISLSESAYQTNQKVTVNPPTVCQLPNSSIAEENKLSDPNINISSKNCQKIIAEKKIINPFEEDQTNDTLYIACPYQKDSNLQPKIVLKNIESETTKVDDLVKEDNNEVSSLDVYEKRRRLRRLKYRETNGSKDVNTDASPPVAVKRSIKKTDKSNLRKPYVMTPNRMKREMYMEYAISYGKLDYTNSDSDDYDEAEPNLYENIIEEYGDKVKSPENDKKKSDFLSAFKLASPQNFQEKALNIQERKLLNDKVRLAYAKVGRMDELWDGPEEESTYYQRREPLRLTNCVVEEQNLTMVRKKTMFLSRLKLTQVTQKYRGEYEKAWQVIVKERHRRNGTTEAVPDCSVTIPSTYLDMKEQLQIMTKIKQSVYENNNLIKKIMDTVLEKQTSEESISLLAEKNFSELNRLSKMADQSVKLVSGQTTGKRDLNPGFDSENIQKLPVFESENIKKQPVFEQAILNYPNLNIPNMSKVVSLKSTQECQSVLTTQATSMDEPYSSAAGVPEMSVQVVPVACKTVDACCQVEETTWPGVDKIMKMFRIYDADRRREIFELKRHITTLRVDGALITRATSRESDRALALIAERQNLAVEENNLRLSLRRLGAAIECVKNYTFADSC